MDVITIVLWTGYFMVLYLVMFWLQIFLTRKKEKQQTDEIKSYPYISVAIPAYNEEKNIEETINSVLNLDYPRDKIEIMVINDGSRDNTEEVVKRVIKNNPGRDIWLYSQVNKGKAAALNMAIRIAKGEFFVSFDADSMISSDALRKILPRFGNDKRIAAVLPFMKVYNPTTVYQKMQWFEYMINFFYKKLMSDIDCANVTPGPFSVYRKEVLEEIGGFDEKNLTEDLEIALKIQKNHYKIIQLLTTDVYTKAPSTLKALYNQRKRWYKGTVLNALKYRDMFLNKKYGDFAFIQMPRLLLEWIILIGIAVALIYSNVIEPLLGAVQRVTLTGIHFSISSVMDKLKDLVFLDFNITTVFFMAVSILFSVLLLVYAHKEVKENLLKHNPLHMIGYMALYSLFVSVTFVFVAIDLLFRRVQKW